MKKALFSFVGNKHELNFELAVAQLAKRFNKIKEINQKLKELDEATKDIIPQDFFNKQEYDKMDF